MRAYALSAIAAKQVAAVPGWQLVPVEPTPEMIERGMMALLGCPASELSNFSAKLYDGYEDDVRRVLAAALAAAPTNGETQP